MKKKVYISGPITGTKDYMEKFAKAEEVLKSKGYSVINPAKVNAQLPEDTTYEQYMQMSITMMNMQMRFICCLDGTIPGELRLKITTQTFSAWSLLTRR